MLIDRLAEVEASLVMLGDDERARRMAAYMKDHFPFLGVQAKPRRDAQRAVTSAAKQVGAVEVLEAAEWCWQRQHRELQYVGCDLLRAGAAALGPEHLPRVRALIEQKSWWDTVDSLAAHTVGTMVAGHPELVEVMDAWVHDDDMWVVRTAILHQLDWKQRAQPERLFAYAEARAADTEFFIRKAIGWALRSLARHYPDEVRRFVDDHRDQLSGLTIREATKHL